MKRSELALNVASIPVDVLMLLLAGVAAFYLREHQVLIARPVRYELTMIDFLKVCISLSPVLLALFASFGLYHLRGVRRFSDELWRTTAAVSLGLLLTVVLFFFNQEIFPSRYIILVTCALAIAAVSMGRWVLRLVQRAMFEHGIGLHRLALLGNFSGDAYAIERVYKSREHGYEVVLELPATIESIAKVKAYHQTHGLDEVLQADPSIDTSVNLELVKFTRNSGLNFSFVPNLFEAQARSVEVASVRGIPVVVLKNSPLDGWGQVVKRVFDIAASIICLCLTAPLFLGVWIAVRTGSKGPAIYSALRGGCGSDFMFFKFRSMYTHLSVGGSYGGEEAEKVRQQLWQVNDRGGKDAAFLKIKDDPRVTPVGKFIRRTKLDEIPQFWNVLRGDMSMVGPRAHVIDEVERYRSEYRRMFSIKPGIFGLSQVAQIGWPDLPFEEEIRLNTFYIENWSFWLDIRVLAQSFYLLFLARKPKADY